MKNYQIAIGAAVAIVMVFALTGIAQYNFWSTPQNPIPRQVSGLYYFDGNWQGEAVLVIKGKTMPKFQVTHGAYILAHSRGVRIDYRGDVPGMGPYKGINILGYNAADDAVHLFTVDSFGYTHDHIGYWADDRHLIFEYDGTYNLNPTVERLTITITNPAKYSISDTISVEGRDEMILNASFIKL